MARGIVSGGDEFARKMRQAPDLAMLALKAALFEEQSAVIAEAQTRTPVDTGTLRGSGTVLPPEQNGSQVEVVAGFGGAAQQYAIRQHEDLSLSHSVGQAKFLEQPFLERAPKIPSNIAKRVERAWERLRKS
jgi:hypothetical protein